MCTMHQASRFHYLVGKCFVSDSRKSLICAKRNSLISLISKLKHKLRFGNKKQNYTKMDVNDHMDSTFTDFIHGLPYYHKSSRQLGFIC